MISPCQPGFLCESVGCNRVCRGKGVLPVEPLWSVNPIDPVRPINPINTRCITQCQMSSDCGINGRCVRQGCNRVCENRGIGNVLPIGSIIPGLPNLGCRDECRRSIECGVGAVCIRRDCRRVCEVSVIVKGCANQCNSSNECPFNQVCIRRGCGNVCARNTVGIKY